MSGIDIAPKDLKAIWIAVYAAAYVQAAEGRSLARNDVADLAHRVATMAADKAVSDWKIEE